MKKLAIALMAVITLFASCVYPAEARYFHYGWGGRLGWGLGGFAAGAALGSAFTRPYWGPRYYFGPGYYYGPPYAPRVHVYEGPAYYGAYPGYWY